MNDFIKNMFSKKENKKIKYANKWIHIKLVTYFDGKLTKKEITQIAEDIVNIVLNTHSVVGKDGNVTGYVNPYVGLNVVSVSKSEKGIIKSVPNLYDSSPKISKDLSREFSPIIEKKNDRWKISIIPQPNKSGTNNLYSLEMLSHDIWPLAGATNIVCEKYQIPIKEERPTFNPIIIDGVPCVEVHDHLFIIAYFVADRLKYEKENPELDKSVLGIGFKSFNELIKLISKNQPNSEWVKKVKKIQEEYCFF